MSAKDLFVCSFVCFAETGAFWAPSPLPQVRFSLRAKKKTFLSDDKLVGKVTVVLKITSPGVPLFASVSS